MSRYTGPKWRINRRENSTVVGVSEKWKRRTSVPGQVHGSRRKASPYAEQFREKQKVKRTFGMTERQFRRFYALAQKSSGNTSTHFLQLLELRVDNVLFRLGLAKTRNQARQMVTHGHVTLNGRKHNVPSTILKAGDEIKLSNKMTDSEPGLILKDEMRSYNVPEWLEKLADGGKVVSLPTREMMDSGIRERLIVELYSK